MKDDAEDIHDGFGRANGVTEPERNSEEYQWQIEETPSETRISTPVINFKFNKNPCMTTFY